MYDPKLPPLPRLASLWRHARGRSRQGDHSAMRQLGEMACLKLKNGFGPASYFSAGLYRRELSWADKCQYLSVASYNQGMAKITPRMYRWPVIDKIVSYGVLSTFGIPQPRLYGIISPHNGRTPDGQPLRSPEDLRRMLGAHGLKQACFKHIAGTAGRGFYKVRFSEGCTEVTIEPEEQTMSLTRFWNEQLLSDAYHGYFCQSVVEQHPDVGRFNPHSLNTARVFMAHPSEDSWEMFGAVMRIGVGETSIDNICAGGLGCNIDIHSGTLGAGTQRSIARPIYEVHPSSGVRIEGSVVPQWEEATALCHETARLFPYIRYLGLDLAFSVDGPLIIELTATSDEMQGFLDRGYGGLFQRLLRDG